jgi:hypothetical protein
MHSREVEHVDVCGLCYKLTLNGCIMRTFSPTFTVERRLP